jgi:hypothetical protein
MKNVPRTQEETHRAASFAALLSQLYEHKKSHPAGDLVRFTIKPSLTIDQDEVLVRVVNLENRTVTLTVGTIQGVDGSSEFMELLGSLREILSTQSFGQELTLIVSTSSVELVLGTDEVLVEAIDPSQRLAVLHARRLDQLEPADRLYVPAEIFEINDRNYTAYIAYVGMACGCGRGDGFGAPHYYSPL